MCVHPTACRDLKESLEQAEEEMRQKKSSATENGASDSPGPAKEEGQRGSKVASQMSSLLAMKKAINGDMFTEEKNMFEEKYLVSGSCSLCVCVCCELIVCVCVPVSVCVQSPSSALLAEGGYENPTLKDNWDDAEGYYRECLLHM